MITRVRPEDKGVYRCYARNRNSRDFQQVGRASFANNPSGVPQPNRHQPALSVPHQNSFIFSGWK